MNILEAPRHIPPHPVPVEEIPAVFNASYYTEHLDCYTEVLKVLHITILITIQNNLNYYTEQFELLYRTI